MTRTKLLSSDPLSLENLFPSDEFEEVLSPLVEPEAEADVAVVDECLKVLGCYSSRPVSLLKLRVLLSSFLLQSQRLEDRVQRKGGELIIGWPHDEAYWRIRSQVGYKISITLRKAMIEHGWITHKVGAKSISMRAQATVAAI